MVGPMFRRWAVLLVLAGGGCGIDDRGIHGGAAEEEAGAVAGGDAAAAVDLPIPRDGGITGSDVADAPLQTPCGPGCQAPANADPVCAGGQCGFACRRGFHQEGASCARNDQASCCGDACVMCAPAANGAVACANQQCVVTCNSGFHPLGLQCQANDGIACCGASCARCAGVSRGTAQCRGGACDFVCDAGFHKEGAGCAMDDNPACCGAACTRCAAPANGLPRCISGQCLFACQAGYHPLGDACHVNDDLACCGPSCQMCTATRPNATPGCGPGGCADPSPCLASHHDCNGLCVANDAVTSCGAACAPCPDRPNATVACNGTACVYTCPANFADCDGNPNNGCEANLLMDPQNCGGCGTGPKDPHVCAAGGNHQQVCVSGQCGCPAGWGNCNDDGSDGCEVNLLTSNVHCGACNPHNPSELDLLTEASYKAADADPACRVYKLETCELGHCKGP
jgi:hypothetical protein